jgi:hypothetical protein
MVQGGKAAKAAVEGATRADESGSAAQVVQKAGLHTNQAVDELPALKQTAETAGRKPPVVIGKNMA